MKKVAFTILTAFVYLGAFAQQNTLEINISREDYAVTEIQTQNEQLTLIETGNTLAANGNKYEFARGKGGEKDAFGVKERRKQYLLNNNSDTVATILDKEEQIRIKNTVLNIEKTEGGSWKYISDSGELYCAVDLFWNQHTWKYTINFHKENEVADVLQKAILLTMIDRAVSESKCESDDSNSALWFSLYALSLAQK